MASPDFLIIRCLEKQAPTLKRWDHVWICALLLAIPACNGSKEESSKSAAAAASSSKAGDTKNTFVFADIAQQVQLEHVYHNGEEAEQFTYLEAMGGGLGVLDFDQDGWPDLFFPGGGQVTQDERLVPLKGTLYRNLDGARLADVAESSRTGETQFYTQGAAAGDINNDGFPDLLVTGYGGLSLFLNLGDGTFVESANELGLYDPSWSTSAAFGDLDGDGFLDLYVAHYVDWSWENHPQCKSSAGVRDICPPAAFHGLQDAIFMNLGDGSFRRVTSEVGLVAEGKGLGVVCADFNQDNRLDVYVANDTTNNFLYMNQGNGKFKEVGIASGTALDENGVSNGSMGISVLDFDGDLNPDIWVCNYENETFALYKNDGYANFRHVTSSTGVAALGSLFVAFGTVAADFDSDGDEDIVAANGHVLRFPPGNEVEQSPLMLINSDRRRFSRFQADPTSYFGRKWRGRGVVTMDFDQDGDLDLALSHVNQPAAVLENRTVSAGKWCSLALIGRSSNRDAIGARVVFRTDGNSYLRMVMGGGSYLSQSMYHVHCAFPANETLRQVEIGWPSGSVQIISQLETNRHHQIIEDIH